jgi:hypothetical protein
VSRLATSLAAALAVILVALPPTAAADGDPASDVLLAENVFYPYSPATSKPLQRQLDAATATAVKLREPVKVALIASPVDLGTIPELFGKPQEYAEFLEKEINFTAVQPLLVVMAAGYGTQGLPGSAAAAVAALDKPAGRTSDDLAAAALKAVEKITASEGRPLTGPATPTSSSAGEGGGDGTAIIVIVLAILALAATGLLARATLRRRGSTV